MSDFLSQDEINSLLKASQEIDMSTDEPVSDGGASSEAVEEGNIQPEATPAPAVEPVAKNFDGIFSDVEKDALGEVGNISMATSATTLSTLLSKKVNITTPTVNVVDFGSVVKGFTTPYIILQVKFAGDLAGTNILIMGIREAVIISRLMMGQEVTAEFNTTEISELEMSAVSEAMNQMIGSASTAIATMLNKFIDIAPPITGIGDSDNPNIESIDIEETIVHITFKMTIEDLVDSEIMQIYSVETAKNIVTAMMGDMMSTPVKETPPPAPIPETPPAFAPIPEEPAPAPAQQPVYAQQPLYYEAPIAQRPQFANLPKPQRPNQPKNIALILDVPMEMSVVLGRAQRSVKQILSLGPGSIIELNKYAEEPLDIFVNGMLIGQGEVVVIDEKFGIKVNTIVSQQERAESMGNN